MQDGYTATEPQINREDDIATLNDLIETCRDGEKGFTEAQKDVKDADLQALFSSYSAERAKFVTELTNEVKRMGGPAEKSGSVAGAAHRGWIDVKSAMTDRDRKAILNECERGEDYAKAAYEKAIKKNLAASTLELIERQYRSVKGAHDRVKQLRDTSL